MLSSDHYRVGPMTMHTLMACILGQKELVRPKQNGHETLILPPRTMGLVRVSTLHSKTIRSVTSCY